VTFFWKIDGCFYYSVNTENSENSGSDNFYINFVLSKYFTNYPFFVLLVATQLTFALNNVAVLELLSNESVAEHVKIEESRHLTDELRRQAVTVLPKNKYSVLTRDNIISLIPPDEKEAACLAESCAVDIGRAIGAEYVTQGTIGRFGNKFTISVELYETLSGKLISSIVFESENIDGLLGVIRAEAKPLFQSILKQRPSHIEASQDASGIGVPQWVGIGLAVAGLGAGVYGVLQESQYKKLHRDYRKATATDADAKWQKVEDAKSRRNMGYIIGSALLAGGITVWFVF